MALHRKEAKKLANPVRIGSIGAMFNAKFHLLALKQVRGVEIVGVHALAGAPEYARMVKDAGLGDCKVYDDIGALAHNVDVVSLSIPNDFRIGAVEQLVAAKDAGAGFGMIVCEKPLARNLAEANRMIDLVKGAGIIDVYYENQNHMPAITAARAQLAGISSKMGSPYYVGSSERHGGPHASWFWNPTRQGGGVMLDMGCHSIGVAWLMLTPPGKSPMFLRPIRVLAKIALLQWGQPAWREKLLRDHGVDYGPDGTPAEDFCSAMIDFRNPDTGQIVVGAIEDSWCHSGPGLQLKMEALAPGHAFNVDTTNSPLTIFIADSAAEAIKDAEAAIEKAQASRGLLTVLDNEPWTYGYVGEWIDAINAFCTGGAPLLGWDYGREIVRILMAAYMSAEEGCTIDINDPDVETFIPAVQKGEGAWLFYK